MSTLAERLAALPLEKRAEFEKRLAAKVEKNASTTPALPQVVLEPQHRYEPFPLTDIQQAYWLGRRSDFELGNVACQSYYEMDVPALDLSRFTHAVQRIIARHDMLRAIVREDGQQQVLAHVPVYQLPVIDLRDCGPDAINAHLNAIRLTLSHRVGRTDQWPLFSIRASQLTDQQFRLHITIDRLLSDAQSGRILFQELLTLYEHPDTALAPLEITFRDCVMAEQAHRTSADFEQAQAYWFDRLATIPPAPELPLTCNPSTLRQPRFVRRRDRLPPEVWQRLQQRAKQYRLTPSGLVLAAFAEVLRTWSKNPRFTLNLTLFHRPPVHPQVNEIIGDFTSTALVQIDYDPQAVFAERAKQVQEQLWSDMEHRMVSGVQVLRELARVQQPGSRLLMPVVLTSVLGFEREQQEDQPSDGSDARLQGTLPYDSGQTPQVWLDHQVGEIDGALGWRWDAVEALFPAGLLDDMFAAYSQLLNHLANDEATWQQLHFDLLPYGQLHQRAAINDTAMALPPDLLHTRFATQANAQPHHPAVITPSYTLTYEHLQRRATDLAQHLRTLGAQPNALVAIVMEKGWEQVVAVLAILEAGAAYLPIDPELPPARQTYLLQHGEVHLVLTQSWIDRPGSWPGHLECVNVDHMPLPSEPLSPLPPVQHPDDLAYVIYTSGSTGQPKGVMIDHRGALNTIVDLNARFEIGPADRVLALSALSFDLSVYDIFGLLAAGGTIVMPGAGTQRDPDHWHELMEREQVTVWNSVPALMELLVESAQVRGATLPESLRLVWLSGDWIPVTLPNRVRVLQPEVELISMGGATEASIWSILYRIEEVDPSWTSIPYGQPLGNQWWQVLNEGLEPVPQWVPGDLYIGGLGLAQGYWRDEAKTQERFIVHPQSGERLYHTGDLGRYLPDGNLEFLGREDFQVKISGHRIELGEIEVALEQHPQVHQAVVNAVGADRGHKRLVAYVVPEHESATTAFDGELVALDEIQQPANLLRAPVERLEFKLKEPGLRHDLSAQPTVQLPPLASEDAIEQTYARRRSYRIFQDDPLTCTQLSELLGCLRQWRFDGFPVPKYRYPSAGGLYPVQTYVYVAPGRVEGLPAGTYYYHPGHHQLVCLSTSELVAQHLHAPVNQAMLETAAFTLFLVADLDAIEPLYGTLARDFCLLEAGYMSQLLSTEAPSQQLGLCAVGSLDTGLLQEALELGERRQLLHTLIGGGIEGVQSTPEGLLQEAEQQAATRSSQEFGGGARLQEMQGFLGEKLPSYMIPSACVLLDELPLSANGKVDRQALPLPDWMREGPSDVYVAPVTAVERALSELWAEVLDVERVGLHDDFFMLGGHSLMATQLIARISEAFQAEVPLRHLLENPSVGALAQILETYDVAIDVAEQPPQIVLDAQHRYEPFPLTDIQQAYWLGRRSDFELGNVACQSYFEMDVPALDLSRFMHAVQRMIVRHDMLRAIVREDGLQQVFAQVPVYPLSVIDLRDCDPDAINTHLNTMRSTLSHHMGRTDQWPLFSIRASQLTDQQFRLHLNIDRLLCDALSTREMFRELFQIYEHPDTALAPLEITFRDCVMAEQGHRTSADFERAQAYWFDRLATLPPAPELPLARNPSTLRQPRFVRRRDHLLPEVWQRLQQRAKQHRLTPSGLVLAAFAEVLRTWSKNACFTLNLTLFNRPPVHPQVNDIIGDFTSTVLVQVDYDPQAVFAERAKQVQEQLWSDMEHRMVSGVQVLRELSRVQQRAPGTLMPVVLTSMLGMNWARASARSSSGDPNEPPADSNTSRLQGTQLYHIGQTPQVWLDHQVGEMDGGLMLQWDAVEALFPAGLLDDMFAAYSELLNDLANDEATWQQLHFDLLPHGQLHQRAAINDTTMALPPDLLHTRFATQANAQPQHPAVITPSHTLTYEHLQRRATDLAQHLRTLGAQPNALVAIVMEKGWEQVVAVLAILEAGAAYLPIDPELPPARQTYLLQHGEVHLVLTQSWIDRPGSWPGHLECVNVDHMPLPSEPLSPLPPVQHPDDLAYVIYTSGSTGQPKGVMIDHRGALNTIVDLNARFEIGPADRVLALSALSFDLSVYDIFGLLAAGGTIVMPGAGTQRDPDHWHELMEREQVTVWNSVPALMELLVESAQVRGATLPESLRLVWLSGDWIPVTLPNRIRVLQPEVELISMGGATEASIWSILYRIEEVDPSWTSIPYGQPLGNQWWQVLNEGLEPVPQWVPGDLYIGGLGLAQGYWRDEAKTQERFIVHPQSGERLYHTGDLGRYLPDGNLEFLGREDFQVKISGHRIELGEIEVALEQHPQVHQAVVNAVGADRGHKRLVAYVVPDSEAVEPSAPSPFDGELVAVDEIQQPANLLRAPVERLEFKLKEPGLRHDLSAQPTVQLPPLASEDAIEQTYARRRSYRLFQDEPLTCMQLSELLGCLRQWRFDGFPVPKYRYPSAGGLYPVQTYVYVAPNRVEGLPSGTYYYHPGHHQLVCLSTSELVAQHLHAPVNQAMLETAAFTLFLVADLDAIEPLYGTLARDFCLLEAGYMSQLLSTEAPSQQLGLCAVGSLDTGLLQEALELGERRQLLHTLIGGGIEGVQSTPEGLLQEAEQQAATRSSQEFGGGARLQEMQGFLGEKLPSYMIPSACVLLDELPLSANGKVDRQALPLPDWMREGPSDVYVAPVTAVERALSELWAEVLDVERVGLHDDFFMLGGHSLLAMQVIAWIRATFKVEVPLRPFFENPTVSGLTQMLTEAETQPGQTEALAQILQQVQAMSPEAVQVALEDRQAAQGEA